MLKDKTSILRDIVRPIAINHSPLVDLDFSGPDDIWLRLAQMVDHLIGDLQVGLDDVGRRKGKPLRQVKH